MIPAHMAVVLIRIMTCIFAREERDNPDLNGVLDNILEVFYLGGREGEAVN